MNFINNLINAMADYELYTNTIELTTGKYHRFKSAGVCKKKCCEYRIFENELGAHFRCWRRGIDKIWFDGSIGQVSLKQRIEMALERERIALERKQAYDRMALKCSRFYAKMKVCNPDAAYPYLIKKQIFPIYTRECRGMLVLAIRDADYKIMSLQFIKPNGFKQFKTGATVAGGMIWLCDEIPKNYDGVIRICEGYATGVSIYEAMGGTVVCALNAYNLINVGKALRNKYPRAGIKICADNDAWGKQNVGLEYALKTDTAINAIIYYPTFAEWTHELKPTDFNDLQRFQGTEEVYRQLILIRR